ncbi:MAG: MerR family transcriptional regulator [Gammaproteobacteria bacterium]|nr:MerR family transcriptional regulator [Gammaproteobacteria bacterium]
MGELAKQVGERNSAIRYWTKQGLLDVAEITDAGYQLYASESVDRVRRIQAFKEQRFTLREIMEKISSTNPK